VQTFFFRRTNMKRGRESPELDGSPALAPCCQTVDLFPVSDGETLHGANALRARFPELGIAMDMSVQLKVP